MPTRLETRLLVVFGFALALGCDDGDLHVRLDGGSFVDAEFPEDDAGDDDAETDAAPESDATPEGDAAPELDAEPEGDAGSEDPDAEVPACPEPGGPTMHSGAITEDTTWAAADGPHVVSGRVDVREGATLTIEPCVVVEFEARADLNIAFPGTPTQGALVAEGDASRPIAFRGRDGAEWGHILVHAPGTARLAHVRIEGGGATEDFGASLLVYGANAPPTHPGLFVVHVEVKGARGTAVVLDRRAAFIEGSTAFSVTDSGNSRNPFPLRVDEHGMGSVPAGGEYTGNEVDAILVAPRQRLSEDATLRSLGVPWRVGVARVDHLTVGTGRGGRLATLTVEAGATLEFFPGTALRVEHETGAFPASGALMAQGSQARPVVFRSAARAPRAGDWVGLWFGGIVSERTQLRHARIEHTGADCGCVLQSCNTLDGYEGAVIMSQPPDQPFVQDSVIADGAGHGVVLGYFGGAVDFSESNRFENLAGCDVTLPATPTCPNPRPACD